MRRSLAPFSGPESLVHTRSLADFITTMSGFRFSVHTTSVASAPEALSQLEGGDAEHPLQAQRWDRAGIHARSLEYRREP